MYIPTTKSERARLPAFDIPIFNSRSTDSRTLETSRKSREFLRTRRKEFPYRPLKKLAVVVSGEKNDSYRLLRKRKRKRENKEKRVEKKNEGQKRDCDTTE